MQNTIIIIFLAFLLFDCDDGEKEMIVLPENFKGYIVVIFNQKDGQSKKYEDGNRVYEIPKSGVLKTQFSADYDWRDGPEFYYRQIEQKNKLATYLEIDNVPDSQIVGFMGANGKANGDLEGKETIPFSKFYVGTKTEIEKFKEEAEKLDIIKLAE